MYTVTGGAGFIGSHLVDELLRRGHAVRVVDDLSTGRRENLPVSGRVEIIKGDVADPAVARRAAAGASIVLHQATVHSGATVGAGAVVRNRMDVPANALAVGVPAQIKLDASGEDAIVGNAATYVANAQWYKKELRPL